MPGPASSPFAPGALPPEHAVGQRLIIGFDGLSAPDAVLRALADGRAGGVILFARNIGTPDEVAALTASLHTAARYPLVIGIDQEGGTVARLRGAFTESPGALALAAGDGDGQAEARTEAVSAVLGLEMRALGINWTYAPAVDLLYHPKNPTLGTRSFGLDPAAVSRLGAAAVRGFQSAAIAACAKHFPGLGDTAIDSHLALPRLTATEAALLERDLAPYRACIAAGVASIMTTHTVFEALDADLPATLSPVIVARLLRGLLGYTGVVTTDCMEMKAIASHHTPGESAVLAALAGVDTILFSHTAVVQQAAYDGLLRAAESGRIPAANMTAALERIARLKAAVAVDAPPDLTAIRTPDHLATVQEAARAGVVHVSGVLPHPVPARTVVVEFVSYLESGIVEVGGQTGLAQRVAERLPAAHTVSLPSIEPPPDQVADLIARAAAADLLIVATRSAAWNPEQAELAGALMRSARATVLLALRTPFDAALFPQADAVLAACGDSAPSLDAVLAALMGDFTPTGRLPVALDDPRAVDGAAS